MSAIEAVGLLTGKMSPRSLIESKAATNSRVVNFISCESSDHAKEVEPRRALCGYEKATAQNPSSRSIGANSR
jgi:hypothetical protein